MKGHARTAAIAGVVGALAATATSALAGSGVGGIFNLGQSNSVNATTELTGHSPAQLSVVNSSGNTAATAVQGQITSSSPGPQSTAVRGSNAATTAAGFGVWGSHAGSGAGVYGTSVAGLGVLGNASNGVGVWGTGGKGGGVFVGDGADGVDGSTNGSAASAVAGRHTGGSSGWGVYGAAKVGTGVEGVSTGGDGVRGGTNALKGAGVYGHHDGSAAGPGVAASSANGPALALSQADANTAAPETLNGTPFPNAAVADKQNVDVPNDSHGHTVGTMSLPAGSYALVVKIWMEDFDEAAFPGSAFWSCELQADSDSDLALGTLAGIDDETMSLELFHQFSSPGSATLVCGDSGGPDHLTIRDLRIMAIRVAGGANTTLP